MVSEVLGNVAGQCGLEAEVMPAHATVVRVGQQEDLHLQDLLNGGSSSHHQEGLILKELGRLQVEFEVSSDAFFCMEQ